MNVYESIMQGLTEAVDYQQSKVKTRKTKLSPTAKLALILCIALDKKFDELFYLE